MLTIISLIFWIIAVIIAITVHEFAHAFSAEKLGDPTARLHDRLSLNPLKHYDPVGTSLLFGTAILNAIGVPIMPIGWAKPVPFDPYNLRNPKRDSALIALAGPISNFIVATISSLLLNMVFIEIPLANSLFISLITINVVLALFNLIPVYPLDGSKILLGILPRNLAIEYESIMRSYGTIILIFLIFPFAGRSAISAFLSPLMNLVLTLFL